MIIVEGPDNSGKTTLIRQLIAMDPSLRLLKRDRFKPELGETIGSSYLRALLPEGHDFIGNARGIADRMLASEEIYGYLYRGGSRVTHLEKRLIINILRAYDAVLVFCDPGDDVIMSSWDSEQQEKNFKAFRPEETREMDPVRIAHEYRISIYRCFDRMNIQKYNWTAPDAEAHRRDLIELHNKSLWWLGC